MEFLHLTCVESLEQGEEQVLFVLEVGVDGALGEAGRSGHLVERRAVEARAPRAPARPRRAGGRESGGACVSGVRGSSAMGGASPS